MSDNPPAFPSEQHETQDGSWNQTYDAGMSLRDWFAGQSLPAVIRTCANDTAARSGPEAYFAAKAYAIADAMLTERAKGSSS